MSTIREQLIKWRDEDVETYITDSEIDILESIVCKMLLKNSSEWLSIINEAINE